MRTDPETSNSSRVSGPGEEHAAVLEATLRSRPEIDFAYLYGSGVAGDRHGLSDVDVAVCLTPETRRELDERDDRGAELRLWIELHAEAQVALSGVDVDLVFLHRAPPLLADRVLRSGRLLFSRDESRRVEWAVATKSRFCDLAPLRGTLNRALDRRIRSGRFGHRRKGASG